MCSHLVFLSPTDSCVFSGVCTMLCFLIPTDAVMLFCVLNSFHLPFCGVIIGEISTFFCIQ